MRTLLDGIVTVGVRMGHTVWSQRVTLDILISELRDYGKALRLDDREVFENLLKKPLCYVGSVSNASSMHTWAFLLLSILLEHEKRIIELEEANARLVDGCVQEEEQYHIVD